MNSGAELEIEMRLVLFVIILVVIGSGLALRCTGLAVATAALATVGPQRTLESRLPRWGLGWLRDPYWVSNQSDGLRARGLPVQRLRQNWRAARYSGGNHHRGHRTLGLAVLRKMSRR